MAGWWSAYASRLDSAGLSPTAREVIARDSAYIVERGLNGEGRPGDAGWPESRVRKGLVMGAVQSGKTASLLGVSAMALDDGIDILVVLAGTRLALWRQTYERLLSQLDGTSSYPSQPTQDRILVPSAGAILDPEADIELGHLYSLNRVQARRALSASRPILIVAMKNVRHLRALAEVLHGRVFPSLEVLDRPAHMLVLDDEADDASILDARIESGRDPVSFDLKQVPRAIVDLWETRPHNGTTARERLFVTYVAYTATPQANFLQSDHNPLAPTHFMAALRTPFDQGDLEPREAIYREPAGFSAYYTGGEAFYRRIANPSPCVVNESAPLLDALRSYLVAGAVRLWADQDRLRPTEARTMAFATAQEAMTSGPAPHTMLVHPSAAVADQFAAAADLITLTSGFDVPASRTLAESGEGPLPAQQLVRDLQRDLRPWQRWLNEFESSAVAVQTTFDSAATPASPPIDHWPEVEELLLNEVLPNLRFAVINSDPRADDRPRFAPERGGDQTWACPRDLFTVFIAGNVMSRGLTLEGLSTTVFLRHADEPLADTQMQMQRWFGFRGRYFHTCRVFLSPQQAMLFRRYHEDDEALRRAVIGQMNRSTGVAPNPIVLHGEAYLATGKIADLGRVPLCPGAAPFVRILNEGVDPNAELVAETFGSEPSSEVIVRDVLRGRVLDRTLSLLQAADLLDRLSYEQHQPSTHDWEGARWASLEDHVGVDHGEIETPFYRPPPGGSSMRAASTACPYSIAAYLRLWAACLTRRARGLFPTDDADLPWSMIDLEERGRLQPTFYIGLRYGAGDTVSSGPLAEVGFEIRAMTRNTAEGRLGATWGSRNPRGGAEPYLGDSLFDYHVHQHTPPQGRAGEPSWRPVGAPGLILFHPVQRLSGAPAIAVGVAIPLGGPDQFAATAAA